ncbi:MAG TPA: class I SAM-dependent methyltransferase [Ilumatobacteraceae bacterium]
MAQNIYDDAEFFAAYSNLRRSIEGLAGAPEWPYLRAMLPDMSGCRVVDLGCGFGWFSRWAAEAGATSVLGIDLSEKMLERARAETDDARITYRQGDLDVVDLPAASFEVAYSSLALHYLVDLRRFMSTVGRAVVDGGAFVFSIEHPIYSAPSAQGFVTDAAGHVTWPLDSYALEGPRTTDWLAPGVVKHHRTITTYLDCLQRAGFQLEHFHEWQPTVDEIAAFPDWVTDLDRPQFLLIGASKTRPQRS